MSLAKSPLADSLPGIESVAAFTTAHLTVNMIWHIRVAIWQKEVYSSQQKMPATYLAEIPPRVWQSPHQLILI